MHVFDKVLSKIGKMQRKNHIASLLQTYIPTNSLALENIITLNAYKMVHGVCL